MRYFPKKQLSTLSLFIILAMLGAPAIAATRSSRSLIVPADTPICYVQLSGQAMMNLNQLCGMNRQKSNTIDLSIDANGDGVPDQLLAEMQKFRTAMSEASSSEDYRTALEELESRLPYSSQVKQLQTQMRNLQQQLEKSPSSSQQEIFRQLDSIQQKIYADPSYLKVQEAMMKVYPKLDS